MHQQRPAISALSASKRDGLLEQSMPDGNVGLSELTRKAQNIRGSAAKKP